MKLVKISIFWFIAVVLSAKVFADTSVHLKDNKFFVNGQQIPSGCFAQLMTQLNGDNIIASLFLTLPSLRGCIDANDPYPSGNEDAVTIEAKDLTTNLFGLKICERVDGSIGSSCDQILIEFENREYVTSDGVVNVLALTKVGDWR
jgi:hypothetical protein